MLRLLVKDSQITLYHDNCNLPFEVFEQRLGSNRKFGSGTVGVVFVISHTLIPTPLYNYDLRKGRRAGVDDVISAGFIFDLEAAAASKIYPFAVHYILSVLLDRPEFNFAEYEHRDDPRLQPPPPIQQLPCDPALWFMLHALPYDEASYEGTADIMRDYWNQLGIDNEKDRTKLGLESIVGWAGDQMTASRLRGYIKMMAHETNSFHRKDPILVAHGLFHDEIKFDHSLHDQYWGSHTGFGFAQASEKLQVKGVATASVKGPYHYSMERLILQVLAARILDTFMIKLKVATVEQLCERLRHRSPDTLITLAQSIMSQYFSTSSLVWHDSMPSSEHDQVLNQNIMMNRDLLEYAITHKLAISRGDVGLVEALIPRRLLRYAGGGHTNYTVELLELLQGLHKEWGSDIRSVQSHTLFINWV